MLQAGKYGLYPCKISKIKPFRIMQDLDQNHGWRCLFHRITLSPHCWTSWGPHSPPACSRSHLLSRCGLSAPCSGLLGISKWSSLFCWKTVSFPLYMVHLFFSFIMSLFCIILKPTDPEMTTALLSQCRGGSSAKSVAESSKGLQFKQRAKFTVTKNSLERSRTPRDRSI